METTPTNLRKQTVRRNGKWAKLDRRADGTWTAALGWAGEFKAAKVQEFPKAIRHGAAIAADSWLDDNA